MEELSTPERLGATVRGHMPPLDGWRGLAILVVVLHNGASVMTPDGSVATTLGRTAFAAGWIGVSLFFVLSGFLITGILLDTRGGPRFLRNFYIRRTLRIFPLYFATLAVICLLLPSLLPDSDWTRAVADEQVWYWTYLSNWRASAPGIAGLSHFWTLGVEEQFYLTWPLLLVLTGRWFWLVALCVALGSFGSRWWMHAVGMDPETLYQFTNARADALAVGALLAIVARRPEWLTPFWRWRFRLLGVTGAALGALVLWRRGLESHDPWVLVVGQSLVAVAFGVLLIVTVEPETNLERGAARAVSARWLRSLGKYGYAIYVVHFPLTALIGPEVRGVLNTVPSEMRVVLTAAYGIALLGVSLVLALATWHLLERPFLKLKDRLAPRSAAAAV